MSRISDKELKRRIRLLLALPEKERRKLLREAMRELSISRPDLKIELDEAN